MAETSEAEHPPQTNGLPEENEEDDKSKMRPADIDADMREMERRKRVEMIMSSRLFREELERIIESQMKEGGGPAGLLQQIQDMVGAGRLHSGAMFKNSNCVVPINDIRGVESMGYAKGEKILRCKLASVFRLMDLYGWTHGINNNITARLNQEEEHFIVNPYGMMFHEVTASSLVKVDMQGNIVESGTTNFGVNTAGFQLHAAVHSARPDIKCIIHIHTPSVLAVSSLKCGLLPVCQESAVIGEISQHPYLGPISEPEEKDKIARNLGPLNKVMFLTNYGAVCCGETVEEAFFNVYNTVLACETQVKLMPIGVDNLLLLSEESRKQMYDASRKAPEGTAIQQPGSTQLPTALEKKEKRWRIGGMEFEALMRMLDNAGFRTGYLYRTPLVKGEPPRPRNDVEVPPAVSSLGYLLEEEEMYKQGNWKKGFYNKNDRTKWLNSPNVYQKVEILETGTPDPKKITKWVADGSPNHTSTPVKIDGALQFVPKNTNPKEFKKLQQQIKENRRADKITSGPQSHILDEGVSWDEAKKLQDANISMTGDQVIMVGTASKGIIQRGFQHNATVYKTPYAKNPFDYVSDQELEDYKKVVTRKQKGEYYDEDQSESEPLSSSAALPPTGVIKSPPSETEDDSRTEPRVLRIETKTAPVPSQAEVVLSDVDDYPPPHVERSKSQRYPQNKVAEKGVTKRSASLERPKTKPVITDERGNSSTVGVVKARILTLEQLLKEKSTSETLNRNKIKTRTTSTQTVLRIYFEEDSTDYRLDQVGHTIIKPFTNIATSDRSKPTTKPNSISSSYQMENDRRKSLMFELHRELSVKFKNNTVFKKDENINFDKEEYASCTVYSLPNSRTGDIWKEQISTTDFTSDSTNSSPASSLEDEDINSKDDAHSIRSYVGDDYQVGENMGSIENLSSNNSTDSFVSSVNAEDNVVVKTPPLLDEDKQKSQIDIDCSEIKAVKELRNNVTVRKQKQTKNIMTDVNTEDIKNVMEDLLLKVCVMENQESLIKCDHSFHHSSVSVISPTSHSSPLVATCSDSGYEADTDRTIIHNGTALFARFNLDYTITDLDEPLPLPPRRKLDSLDEFSVVESAVNCIKTTDTDHIPRPSRSYSPDFKEQCICRRRRRHSDMIAVKSVESKENETSRQNKSDGDLTANPYCIAPEVIYLQNGHNQVIAFKRTSLDSDLLNKMSCECNQNLKSPMFTLPSENNDDTVEHDIFPSGSKIVESNQEQNINSSLIGKVSNNSPVEISRIRQNASRTSQEVPRLQEIYRDHNSNQFSFTDNHCNTYSSVNDVHDYSHMYRNNNLSNGNGEDILHKEYYYGSHEGDPGHKNNHPSYDIYNHTFSKEDIDSVDNIISYNSLRNHSDLKNVRYFNGMLHNTAFATETQEHIYAAESTYTTPPEESLCVIESQASEYGYDAPKGIDFNNCETTQSLSFPNYPPLQDSTYNGVGRPDCYTETEQQPVYNQDELITYYPQQNSLQYFIVKEGATFTGVPPVNIKNPQELQNQEHNEIISCIEEKQQSDGNCVQEATSLEQNYIFPELYSPIQGQNNNLWATHSDIIENKEINYNTQNLEHYQNSCPDGQEQIMIPEQYYYNNMNNYGNVSSCQYNPYEADNYDPKIGYQYNNQTHYNNINEISTKENEYALTEYDNGCHNTVNNTSLDYTYTMNYMRDYYFEDEAITSFSVNNRYLYTIYENEELIQ